MKKIKYSLLCSLAALVSLSTSFVNAVELKAQAPSQMQRVIDEIAAKNGIKAPNVAEELTGKTSPDATVLLSPEKKMDEKIAKALKASPKIKSVYNMENANIRVIETQDGRVMYLLHNGRFAMIGKLFDIWNQKELTNVNEVAHACTHYDLDRMGFVAEDLNFVRVGAGKDHVTLFVDPLSTYSQNLMNTIFRSNYLKGRYMFDIIVTGIMNAESRVISESLWCAAVTAEQKFTALLEGQEAVKMLPKSKVCVKEDLRQTELQRRVMGVDAVPFVIAPDGRFVKGLPANFNAWLEKKAKPQGVHADTDQTLRRILSVPAKINDAVKERKTVEIEKLHRISVGSGEKHITVYVDPQCGWCHKFMVEVEGNPTLQKKYTFDFVNVSVLGPESKRLNQRLSCAEATELEKWRALLGGKAAIDALRIKDNCHNAKQDANEREQARLGFSGVPFTLTEKGAVIRGKPRHLQAVLEGRIEEPAQTVKKEAQPPKVIDRATLDLTGANVVSVGKGKKRVTVFVDPQCGWCHKLMDEIDDQLLKDYSFDFVVMDVLGPESSRESARIACAADTKARDLFEALKSGKKAIDAIKQKKGCEFSEKLKVGERIRNQIGFSGVPFIVAHDGRTGAGKPPSLKIFLENTSPKDNSREGTKPERVDWKSLNLDINSLPHFTLGSGNLRATLIVDPDCSWCRKEINAIEKDARLLKDYTFEIVAVPVLGETSKELIKKLHCSSERAEAKFKAFKTNPARINALKVKPECHGEAVIEAAKPLVDALNLDSVPVLIAPNGKILTGYVKDLAGQLSKNAR